MPDQKIDWTQMHADVVDSARAFYEGYLANSDGLAWDGKRCPTWDALNDKVKSHWCATVLVARQRARDYVL